MRFKIAAIILALMLSFPVGAGYAQTEPGYFNQMGKTFARGVKNLLSAPWEIPDTIKRYDRKTDGNPRIFRDASGFVDGFFRTVTRYGCSVWDIAFAAVPGQQEGIPLKPEAFF